MAGVAVTPGSGATIAMDNVGSASAPSSGERLQYVKLDYGAAGSSTPVTVLKPLPVGEILESISVTLSLDTGAYANNDLLADAQEVAGVALASGGKAILTDLVVIDEDDNGQAFTVFLSQISDSWGTENNAPTVSDTVVRSIQAMIPVSTYVDVGGAKIAHVYGINAIVETSGTTSLYVAVVNGTGTPTFTASGIKLIFKFKQSN